MIASLLLLPSLAAAQPVALVGAEVRTAAGPALREATVIVDGETIAAVGADVPLPPNAVVIDVRGRILTPGFVAADTQIGLVEVELERSTQDAEPKLGAIRAAARAEDGFDLGSALVPVARRHGITSVVSAPTGGLVSGRGGWFDLIDPRDPAAEAAGAGPVGLYARLGEPGAAAAFGSRLGAMALLRVFLDDVRTFRSNESQYRRNGLYPMSAPRLHLEAAVPVLERKLPLVVEAHRASDILVALRLAAELKLNLVVLGASEGWLVAEALARARVPVIVDPMANLPERFEARAARSDNPALLARAGVKVVLAVRSSHNAGNLRFGVGNAVRDGFPPELALEAVTSVPAEAFGFGKVVGTIARGQRANLVVWTGDPFEPSSVAERVFIRGREQPVESRQSRLPPRYIERLGLVR